MDRPERKQLRGRDRGERVKKRQLPKGETFIVDPTPTPISSEEVVVENVDGGEVVSEKPARGKKSFSKKWVLLAVPVVVVPLIFFLFNRFNRQESIMDTGSIDEPETSMVAVESTLETTLAEIETTLEETTQEPLINESLMTIKSDQKTYLLGAVVKDNQLLGVSLFRILPDQDQLLFYQFPSDTVVEVNGVRQSMGEVFSSGGLELLKESVASLYQIDIQKTFRLDGEFLKTFVNTEQDLSSEGVNRVDYQSMLAGLVSVGTRLVLTEGEPQELKEQFQNVVTGKMLEGNLLFEDVYALRELVGDKVSSLAPVVVKGDVLEVDGRQYYNLDVDELVQMREEFKK